MVHALEEIRRLLKPGGFLIDIHPVAEASPVAVRHGGKSHPVGIFSVRQWLMEYEAADGALAEVVQRGLFTVEREAVFAGLIHADSVDEMRAALAEDLDKYAREGWSVSDEIAQADAIAKRANELLRKLSGSSEITLRERAHISRLRRT